MLIFCKFLATFLVQQGIRLRALPWLISIFALFAAGVSYSCGLPPFASPVNWPEGWPEGFASLDQGYYEGDQYGPFPVKKPQIVIVGDKRDQEFLVSRWVDYDGKREVYRVSEAAYNKIDRTDYPRFLILIAFGGDALGAHDTNLEVKDIWQAGEQTVYLRASILKKPVNYRPYKFNTTYHAIRITRSLFAPGAEYRFVLLDQDGYEISRARGIVQEAPGAEPSPVPFMRVAKGLYGPAAKVKKNELHIIADNGAAQDFVSKTSVNREEFRRIETAILSTDFKNELVVAVLIESPANDTKGVDIKRIDQQGNAIYLKALFIDRSAGTTGVSTPYDIVKISKSGISAKGTVNFIIFDHSGIERARASINVP